MMHVIENHHYIIIMMKMIYVYSRFDAVRSGEHVCVRDESGPAILARASAVFVHLRALVAVVKMVVVIMVVVVMMGVVVMVVLLWSILPGQQAMATHQDRQGDHRQFLSGTVLHSSRILRRREVQYLVFTPHSGRAD